MCTHCARLCVDEVHMCACVWRPEISNGHHSSRAIHPNTRSFTDWCSLIRLSWLDNKAKISAWLYLPRAGVIIPHHMLRVLYGFWGSNPDLPTYKANTLRMEPCLHLHPYPQQPPTCKMRLIIHFWELSKIIHLECLAQHLAFDLASIWVFKTGLFYFQLCVCGEMHMSAGACGNRKRESEPLELEIKWS